MKGAKETVARGTRYPATYYSVDTEMDKIYTTPGPLQL